MSEFTTDFPKELQQFAPYVWRGRVVRVSDGDSLVVRLDAGFKHVTEQRIRLKGINAPELNDPDPAVRERAQAAKAYLEGLCPPDTPCVVATYRMTYDRYEGVVKLAGGKDVADLLVSTGLAQRVT